MKLAIPPDIMSGARNEIGKFPRAIDVRTRVTEEYACHGPSWRAGLCGEVQVRARA